MIQKLLAEKAGPNRPLLLKIQWVDPQIRKEHSFLVDIFSEASWDFPRGTWSSKYLSRVTLAKKANRHALRVIRVDDGESVLPEINAKLKDSLYFI
jgi:hypothetical protein